MQRECSAIAGIFLQHFLDARAREHRSGIARRGAQLTEMRGFVIDWRAPEDPWKGRQPRYEKLLYRPPRSFLLVTKLPSGTPIEAKLERFELQQRRPSP